MKKFIITVGCILFAFAFSGCGNIELKESSMQIELGEKTSIEVSDILDIDEKKAEEITLDTKDVDFKKVGIYKARASYQKDVYEFDVEIIDTTSPKVSLKEDGNYYVAAGTELSSEAILESADDASGIGSISFKENGVQKEEENKLIAYAAYDQAGVFENEIIVTDNNGNETNEKFTITVVEDFSGEIIVDEQIIITQGGSVDWNTIISYEAEKYEVIADVTVDTNVPGDYKVIYEITQKETGVKIKKEVPVIVKEENTSGTNNVDNSNSSNQASSNNSVSNSSSKSSTTSGSGNSSSKSSNTSGSSNSSSKSSNTNGGSSSSNKNNSPSGNSSSNNNNSNGGGGSSSDQSWSGGETQGSGQIDEGGNTGQSGTWY